MLVRLLSDLHLECAKYKIQKLPEDLESVLILAGDIALGKSHRLLVENACASFKHVILILGNHEYYGNEVHTLNQEWKVISEGIDNLHFLNNNYVVLDDVKFLGATMWTDMKDNDWHMKQRAKHSMNDYNQIKIDHFSDIPRTKHGSRSNIGQMLHPDDTVEMYFKTVKFFDDELSKGFDGKTVIITHHLPIYSCISPRFAQSPLNCMYHANCDWLINKHKIDYWFHGHTHDSLDFQAGDTRIVCNPRGYIPYEPNDKFDHLLQILL